MKRMSNGIQGARGRGVALIASACLLAGAAWGGDTPDAATTAPLRIAVVDFSSAEGNPFTSCNVTVCPMTEAGEQLSERVAEELSVWPQYEVLEPKVVQQALKRYRLAKKGLNKPAVLARLAELTGADAVIVGQTEGSAWRGKGHSGANLYASMQMVSTHDADVIWSIDGSVTDTRSAKHVVPSLAKDMTTRLYAQLQELEVAGSMLALKSDDH